MKLSSKAQSFIAPNGKLYKENSFIKASMLINGIEVTELWCDAYQRNLDKGGEVLFPADFCCPFPVVDHKRDGMGYDEKFIEKGGGFRLDWDYR